MTWTQIASTSHSLWETRRHRILCAQNVDPTKNNKRQLRFTSFLRKWLFETHVVVFKIPFSSNIYRDNLVKMCFQLSWRCIIFNCGDDPWNGATYNVTLWTGTSNKYVTLGRHGRCHQKCANDKNVVPALRGLSFAWKRYEIKLLELSIDFFRFIQARMKKPTSTF